MPGCHDADSHREQPTAGNRDLSDLAALRETELSQIPAQHSTVASQTSPVGAQFSIRQIGFPTANAHGPPQHVSVPMQVSPAAWQLRRRQVHLPSKQPHSPEQQSQLRRQAWSTRRQRC